MVLRMRQVQLLVAVFVPFVVRGKAPIPLEDSLPHLDYARLFDRFHSWSARLGRAYATSDAKRAALTAFYYNELAVKACNAESATSGYACKLNDMSDESQAEFKRARLFAFSQFEKQYTREGAHDSAVLGGGHTPQSLDWSTTGAVQPVRSQGSCGASHAFAAVAALEALHAIMTGQRVSLSEQMLLSCAGGSGCEGGLPQNALGWVHAKGGLAPMGAYPYLSANRTSPKCGCCGGGFGLCSAGQPECERAVSCGGYFEVADDEAALQDAVAQQPVVAGIDASAASFRLYSGGVYAPDAGEASGKGGPAPNHAVLLVGYGTTEGGVAYWKLKNSWGASWGEQGYGRLLRGSKALGVSSSCAYPATPTRATRCSLPVEGDVRLTSMPQGVATVFSHGGWAALCADDKRELARAGDLVCKQLGFGGALKAEGWRVLGPRSLVSPQRSCSESAVSLLQCSSHPPLDGAAAGAQDAASLGCESALGVLCSEPAPDTPAATMHASAGSALRLCGSAIVPPSFARSAEDRPVLSASGSLLDSQPGGHRRSSSGPSPGPDTSSAARASHPREAREQQQRAEAPAAASARAQPSGRVPSLGLQAAAGCGLLALGLALATRRAQRSARAAQGQADAALAGMW